MKKGGKGQSAKEIKWEETDKEQNRRRKQERKEENERRRDEG
jgi:hypothetical protein